MIPVKGSAMDAKGAAQILDLLALMKEKAGLDIAHSVVLTRVASMVTTKALLAIKGLLAARGVNVLDTPIGERSAFRELFERSEEHTSELQSLMRISYAVFCLKKKQQQNNE